MRLLKQSFQSRPLQSKHDGVFDTKISSRAQLFFLSILLPILGGGCANFFRPPMAPNDAHVQYLMHKYAGTSLDASSSAQRAVDAQTAIGGKYEVLPEKPKKQKRNEIVNELVYLINDYYDKYEVRWFATSSGIGAVADIATLSLDTIVAASSGKQIRTILAAVSTGIGGSRLALEKDVLKNQSISVIIHTMRATRNKQYSDLQLKLKAQSTTDYPLEEALVDVQNYFHAGTVLGALQELDDAAANTNRLSKDVNEQTARLKSLVDLRAALKAAQSGNNGAVEPSPTAAPVP